MSIYQGKFKISAFFRLTVSNEQLDVAFDGGAAQANLVIVFAAEQCVVMNPVQLLHQGSP
jgi:hypothetical protein